MMGTIVVMKPKSFPGEKKSSLKAFISENLHINMFFLVSTGPKELGGKGRG